MTTAIDAIMVRYNGGTIERMGAAEVEDWYDVQQAADGAVERLSDLTGWAPYTALYHVRVDGADLHYLVAEEG